jgi:hypothetical protein
MVRIVLGATLLGVAILGIAFFGRAEEFLRATHRSMLRLMPWARDFQEPLQRAPEAVWIAITLFNIVGLGALGVLMLVGEIDP